MALETEDISMVLQPQQPHPLLNKQNLLTIKRHLPPPPPQTPALKLVNIELLFSK